MAKNSRKKQKTLAETRDEKQPLGSKVVVDNDAEKDDEERRLESLLFGKAFAPRDSSTQKNEIVIDDDDDEGGGNALQQLQDNDVRFRVS